MVYHINKIFNQHYRDIILGLLFSFGFEDTAVGSEIISFRSAPGTKSLESFRLEIQRRGYSLIESEDALLCENIRKAIDGFIEADLDMSDHRLSAYLSANCQRSYSFLSRCFMEHHEMSIRNYFTGRRIERIKILLREENLSLTEIASRFHFSSNPHFSNHFKKQTGQTPGSYRSASASHSNGRSVV